VRETRVEVEHGGDVDAVVAPKADQAGLEGRAAAAARVIRASGSGRMPDAASEARTMVSGRSRDRAGLRAARDVHRRAPHAAATGPGWRVGDDHAPVSATAAAVAARGPEVLRLLLDVQPGVVVVEQLEVDPGLVAGGTARRLVRRVRLLPQPVGGRVRLEVEALHGAAIAGVVRRAEHPSLAGRHPELVADRAPRRGRRPPAVGGPTRRLRLIPVAGPRALFLGVEGLDRAAEQRSRRPGRLAERDVAMEARARDDLMYFP
jgi:hypothetical protein